jgi:hypothetical protein
MNINPNYAGPLPLYTARVNLAAALAAGAEVTVTANFVRPLPRAYDHATFLAFATVFVGAEANVQYVVQVNGATNSGTASMKVKNVGSAAGTQTWDATVLVVDINDLIT